MLMLWVTLAFIILFPIFVQWFLRDRKFAKFIDQLPGPTRFPIVGTMWIFIGAKREEIFKIFYTRSQKFGPLSRIWVGSRPEIRVGKAELIEPLIGMMENLEKGEGYNFLHKWLGQGLLTSKREQWHKHRKMITPTFHFSILNNFCEVFAEKADILTGILEKHCDTNEPFNVYPYITRSTLDIICSAAMGVDIHAQTDIDNNYVKSINEIAELIIRRLLRPWYKADFIYNLTEDGKKTNRCLETIHNFTTKVIQDRKMARKQPTSNQENLVSEGDLSLAQGSRKRLAFLDLLLEANEKENLLTDLDIREEVDTFMFEGHDTTASGISWSVLLLGHHPDIQDKIFEEIENIFQGSDRMPTLKDLNEMKYLERVIKESMRLYPPVSFIGRTLSADAELDGFKIPKGCSLAVEIYSLHRDEKYFPDPEKFDPDRFLPENTVNRHPYAYLPFSAGPRNCIGQKFALLELKSVLSAIVRKMKIKSCDKMKEVKVVSELILRPLTGVKIMLEKRK